MNNISPSISQIDSANFITYRRFWLDACLETFSIDFNGTVLDVGGKREKKRGTFKPPEKSTNAWWYVNLDWATSPNIFADVASLPIKSESIDVVLCTEVLEHLKKPLACAQETYRILKKEGIGFFSVPFLYPVHADPFDYQRYTADGLHLLLSQFRSIEIVPMGGYLGSLAMLMEIGLPGISGMQLSRKILRRSLGWLAKQLYKADIKLADNQPKLWKKYTSGYFVKVVK